VETDCEHEWEPLEFEDGEKSKASVCSKCGALKSGQGSIVITANYIDFSPLTSNPTLAEGRQWFRSDFDAMYWSPDGSAIERIKTVPPAIASGSLTGIKGFEYLVEGAATDSWDFTMNPSAGVWIKQYSTAASFNAQMVYHGAYQHWTGDNTFVDVPNKADNVYGAGEEVTVHMTPDGSWVSWFSSPADFKGMTWDGEYLWASGGGYIYKLTTGGAQKGGFAPAWTPKGISWDATYLWSQAGSGWVYQVLTDGTQVSSFKASPAGGGCAFDGEYLWIGDRSIPQVYQYTPAGTQKGSFAPAPTWIDGIGWDGEYLWIGGADSRHVYQYTPAGTQIGAFPITSGATRARAPCWDGQYLWEADDALNTYQYCNAGSFDLDYKIAPA